jgi:hypothetical protein
VEDKSSQEMVIDYLRFEIANLKDRDGVDCGEKNSEVMII